MFIRSVLDVDITFYPQVFLEECLYKFAESVLSYKFILIINMNIVLWRVNVFAWMYGLSL